MVDRAPFMRAQGSGHIIQVNGADKPADAPSKRSSDTPAQGGLEKSAEQDDKSNQKPGVHGSDVEKRIGKDMPDRIIQLTTIGYEGSSVADFLFTLTSAGVTSLLDIREIAASRRPGFAKTALRANLSAAGITYRHEPKLGSPRAIRHQLRATGSYEVFFAEFDGYLRTQQVLLERLATELAGHVALMCYERDYQQCHRKLVAGAIGRLTGCATRHLLVQANGFANYAAI